MTDLAPDQIAFVRLHQTGGSDFVQETRHLFQGATIRATTAKGKTATLARDAVQALIDAGLMVIAYGGAFRVTDEGQRV